MHEPRTRCSVTTRPWCLAGMTGEQWRLPTEAEWEKAVRGTDGRIYPWGDEWDAARANTWKGARTITTSVELYHMEASPYGVQNMSGNVFEWCSTLAEASYPYDPNDGREDMNSNKRRVLRGGSYLYDARHARTTSRFMETYRSSIFRCFGFRLAHGTASSV